MGRSVLHRGAERDGGRQARVEVAVPVDRHGRAREQRQARGRPQGVDERLAVVDAFSQVDGGAGVDVGRERVQLDRAREHLVEEAGATRS